jgi:mercuric ion transport protein
VSDHKLIGAAVIACAACCAGPILGVLGGVAALGVVGTVVFGALSLVVVATSVIAAVIITRRRQRSGPVSDDPPIVVRSRR